MTHTLEHSVGHKNTLSTDLDQSHAPEVLDMATGGQVWRGLNTVTEAVADVAEQLGARKIDGLYLLGKLDDVHILAGHEVDNTPDGHPIHISRLQVVDPARGAYSYLGSQVETEGQEIVDIRVHEENSMGDSHNVAFSGSEEDTLPIADAKLTQELAKTLLGVVNVQHEQGKITDSDLLDITEPLVIPELAHAPSKRHLGHAVVNRLVSWIDRRRTAA